MGDHLDNLTFGASTPIGSHDPDLDSVAVHHPGHFPLGEEDVLASVIWNHEAKAIAMTLNRTEAIGFTRH
jgi:hypothetical protein